MMLAMPKTAPNSAQALDRVEQDELHHGVAEAGQHRATRKITIEAWKKIFRPYGSPSLPHSGVETVVASR
jgi:hypothetical protein